MGRHGDTQKTHLTSLTHTVGRNGALRAGGAECLFPPFCPPRGSCQDLRFQEHLSLLLGPVVLGGRRTELLQVRLVLKGQLRGAGPGQEHGEGREGRPPDRNRTREGDMGREGGRSPWLKSTGTRTGTGRDTRHWTERDRQRVGAEKRGTGTEREGRGRTRQTPGALRLGCRGDLGMAGCRSGSAGARHAGTGRLPPRLGTRGLQGGSGQPAAPSRVGAAGALQTPALGTP